MMGMVVGKVMGMEVGMVMGSDGHGGGPCL